MLTYRDLFYGVLLQAVMTRQCTAVSYGSLRVLVTVALLLPGLKTAYPFRVTILCLDQSPS